MTTAAPKALTIVLTLILLGLTACQPNLSAPTLTPAVVGTAPLTPATPTPPADTRVSCADLDAAWGNNWPATLQIIDQLIASHQACGSEALASKKYAALFSYAVVLENGGQLPQAVDQYLAAFNLDPHRREAWDALVRLNRLPAPTPPACLPESQRLNAPYIAPALDQAHYVAAQNGKLVLDRQPFLIRGVNYYPRLTPWYHFLLEANPTEMAAELDLIHQAGFNTIRIFLWQDALFTCRPEQAIPVADTFATVDSVLALAQARNLKVIVTLNDLPDLSYRPLYTDWARYDAQTAVIVQRYKNDPTILAWDLRNEGDLDYGARSPFEARFTQTQVLGWLTHVSKLVKENDPHHLVTAGWWGSPIATASAVDMLSFHHWYDAQQLQPRITDYQTQTNQPLLLEEVGYHSWAQAPTDARDETMQAELLRDVTSMAESQGLSGWMIWTAFDFAPAAGQSPTNEHFFGIWRVDLSAKPALLTLPLK